MAKFKKYVKKYYKRKYKKASLGRQILRLADSKRLTEDVVNFDGKHNVMYSYSPTQRIVQGTTNTTRIGDSVYLQSLTLSGYVCAPAAAAMMNIKFRMIVGWSTKQVATTTLISTGLGTSDVFLPGTHTQFVNGIVNPRAFTVLSDSVIDINSTANQSNDIKSFYMTVPLNQNFDYVGAGLTFGKRKNLYIVCLPFEYNAQATTDSAAIISFAVALKFKDP